MLIRGMRPYHGKAGLLAECSGEHTARCRCAPWCYTGTKRNNRGVGLFVSWRGRRRGGVRLIAGEGRLGATRLIQLCAGYLRHRRRRVALRDRGGQARCLALWVAWKDS